MRLEIDVESGLQEQFGAIDIYVFDQLLRGNIGPEMRVIDAGCGYGRNLVYLLRHGCEIFALDADPDAVDAVRGMAAVLQPRLPPTNFQTGAIESLPFPSATADVVLCSSVLHFARSAEHFHAMVAELWRVLRPGGLLFCRLGSRIGIEFEPAGNGLYYIGDGQAWFLVDHAQLMELTAELGGTLVDPLKTTVVANYRCMTTWVLRKPAAPRTHLQGELHG